MNFGKYGHNTQCFFEWDGYVYHYLHLSFHLIIFFRYHPIPMIVNEQSIVGSVGATLEDLKEAVAYVGDGKLSTVIDSTIPLSSFQEGLDKIKSCSCVGKIVCVPCNA